MASISTDGGVFTVGYSTLDTDGKPCHFQSCYRPGGEAVFERRQDTRPEQEIYLERWKRRREEPPSEIREGIYHPSRFPNLLTFLDKLETEENIFLNWRFRPSDQYSRVAIGTPHFYTNRPDSWPCVSDILFHDGVLALAWVRPTGTAHELIFTQIKVEDAESRKDEVLDPKLRYVTMISAANIGAEVIVVGHRGIRETSDARLVFHFTRISHGD